MKKMYLILTGFLIFSILAAGCGKKKEDVVEAPQVTETPTPTPTPVVEEKKPDLVDMQQITENLSQLKAAGFRIILDDYGSGVTAESDLYNFPLDIVKIDQSLLLDTGTEPGDTAFRTLVKKFIQLGVEVVCEGIETPSQDRFAREAGCHYGQGYLYFRPVSQDQVWELIHPPFQNKI